MKKNYFEPEMEILELKTVSMLCASTGDTETPGQDGENTGTIPSQEPGSSGWGGDY